MKFIATTVFLCSVVVLSHGIELHQEPLASLEQQYSNTLSYCRKLERQPLNTSGFRPELQSTSYKTAILYFNLKNSLQCSNNERMAFQKELINTTPKSKAIKKHLDLIQFEKDMLDEAKQDFEALPAKDKTLLKQTEMFTRPFNGVEAAEFYIK